MDIRSTVRACLIGRTGVEGWVLDRPGVSYRLLHCDPQQGLWVTDTRFSPGVSVPTHLHSGPVIGITLEGCWGYPTDNLWFKPGDYAFELAGARHQVEVPETEAHDARAIFLAWGGLIFGPDLDHIQSYTDALTIGPAYERQCAEQGVTPCDYISSL